MPRTHTPDAAPTASPVHPHLAHSDDTTPWHYKPLTKPYPAFFLCLFVCAGLPSPTVGMWLPMEDAAKLAPLALVVMVVDLLESTSIARALAAKGKYELSANQVCVPCTAHEQELWLCMT